MSEKEISHIDVIIEPNEPPQLVTHHKVTGKAQIVKHTSQKLIQIKDWIISNQASLPEAAKHFRTDQELLKKQLLRAGFKILALKRKHRKDRVLEFLERGDSLLDAQVALGYSTYIMGQVMVDILEELDFTQGGAS